MHFYKHVFKKWLINLLCGLQAQLEGFRVGVVSGELADESERVAYQTWDQLVDSGRIPKGCMPTQNADGKWTLPTL